MYGLRLLSTVPTPAPLDTAIVQTHLRTPTGKDDAYIAGLVQAAMLQAELETHRQILTSTLELSIDRFPVNGQPILLPGGRWRSTTSIVYTDTSGDEQTWDQDNFTTAGQREPAEIWPAFGQVWPQTQAVPEAVVVTYETGYGDTHAEVPWLLKQGLLLLVGHWYMNREAVIVGTIASELPIGVQSIFERYAVGDDFDDYDPRAMRIGELNTLLEHRRKGPDPGLGIQVKYKLTGKTAWCSVEQLAGTELMVAQQINARANMLLKTHWQADILPGDQFVGGGRTFNIMAVNNVMNQNRELQLTCIEPVAT